MIAMVTMELTIVGHQMMMAILLGGSVHHIAILRMALMIPVWHRIIVAITETIRTKSMVRMIRIESMLVKHAVHRCEIIAKVVWRMHTIAVHTVETVRVVSVVE